jgi:tetratricopeptide (TPR) repeat protein
MSRFNNLEFGNHSNEENSPPRSVVKDEHFYLAEAREAYESGRFEQGLRSFGRVIEQNPRCVAAWAGQVKMLIELGEFREAKLWADKAIETFPSDPELMAAKAAALARAGDTRAALAFSDSSIESRGNTPYVWLARGDVLLARKEKRAEFCFEKAISLSGGDWFVMWLISRIWTFYKQFSKALKSAQQGLAADAGRAVLWLELGRCQIALGLPGQAGNAFEQARQLDPGCAMAPELSKASGTGLWTRLWEQWRRCFDS